MKPGQVLAIANYQGMHRYRKTDRKNDAGETIFEHVESRPWPESRIEATSGPDYDDWRIGLLEEGPEAGVEIQFSAVAIARGKVTLQRNELVHEYLDAGRDDSRGRRIFRYNGTERYSPVWGWRRMG